MAPQIEHDCESSYSHLSDGAPSEHWTESDPVGTTEQSFAPKVADVEAVVASFSIVNAFDFS